MSILDEMLEKRQPIHLGGMSDPFVRTEETFGVTKAILQVLAEHRYPTIISTKSDLVGRDDYLRLLKRGNFIVQFSISSMDGSLLGRIDLGTSGPTALLKTARILRKEGVPVTCRVQPLLPTRERDAYEVVDACAEAGILHVAAEHLKLPIEKSWWGTTRLSRILGLDLLAFFHRNFAKRVGREWILSREYRVDQILRLRTHTHTKGMTFAPADNDLLPLADGDCCCSGADFVSGFTEFFRSNYAEAVRRGLASGQVSMSLLDGLWYPKRSLSRHVNSHSRIMPGNDAVTVRTYIERNWNGSPNGNSPSMFFGVVPTDALDGMGFRIYALTDELKGLMNERIQSHTTPKGGNTRVMQSDVDSLLGPLDVERANLISKARTHPQESS